MARGPDQASGVLGDAASPCLTPCVHTDLVTFDQIENAIPMAFRAIAAKIMVVFALFQAIFLAVAIAVWH